MNTTFKDISPSLHKHMVDNPVKDYLYHYTGAAALIGILEHKKLWMSNTEHLNIDLQRKVAKEIAGQRKEDIIKLCPIFKHPSFREEKEWRIISPINRGRQKFRDSPRGLTMYSEFDLSPEELPLTEAKTKDNTFTKIVCGPTINKPGIEHAATRLLAANGFFTKLQVELLGLSLKESKENVDHLLEGDKVSIEANAAVAEKFIQEAKKLGVLCQIAASIYREA